MVIGRECPNLKNLRVAIRSNFPLENVKLGHYSPLLPFSREQSFFVSLLALRGRAAQARALSFVLEVGPPPTARLPASLPGTCSPLAAHAPGARPKCRSCSMDNAGAHRAPKKTCAGPSGWRPSFCLSYCPELNPIRELVAGAKGRHLQPALRRARCLARTAGCGTGYLQPRTRAPGFAHQLPFYLIAALASLD